VDEAHGHVVDDKRFAETMFGSHKKQHHQTVSLRVFALVLQEKMIDQLLPYANKPSNFCT